MAKAKAMTGKEAIALLQQGKYTKDFVKIIKGLPSNVLMQEGVQAFIVKNANYKAVMEEVVKKEPKATNILVKAIKTNGTIFSLINEKTIREVKSVAEIALKAGRPLKDFSNELRADLDFILKAVEVDVKNISGADRTVVINEKEIAEIAINTSSFQFSDFERHLRADEEFAEIGLEQDKDNIKFMDESLQTSGKFIAKMYDKELIDMSKAPDATKKSSNVFAALIDKDPSIIAEADSVVRGNVRLMNEFVKKDGLLLKYGTPEVQNTDTVVESALTENGLAMEHAASKFQSSEKHALMALKSKSEADKFIDSKLIRTNMNVASKVIEGNDYKLSDFHGNLWERAVTRVRKRITPNSTKIYPNFRSDLNFVKKMVIKSPKNFAKANRSIRKDSILSDLAVSGEPKMLFKVIGNQESKLRHAKMGLSKNPKMYASLRFRAFQLFRRKIAKNTDVIKYGIQAGGILGKQYFWLSRKNKKNKTLIEAGLKKNGLNYFNIPRKQRKTEHFAALALANTPKRRWFNALRRHPLHRRAFKFVKGDVNIMGETAKNDSRALKYMSTKMLKKNPQIFLDALKENKNAWKHLKKPNILRRVAGIIVKPKTLYNHMMEHDAIALVRVQQDPKQYNKLSDEQKVNSKIASAALANSENLDDVLNSAPTEAFRDADIVRQAGMIDARKTYGKVDIITFEKHPELFQEVFADTIMEEALQEDKAISVKRNVKSAQEKITNNREAERLAKEQAQEEEGPELVPPTK